MLALAEIVAHARAQYTDILLYMSCNFSSIMLYLCKISLLRSLRSGSTNLDHRCQSPYFVHLAVISRSIISSNSNEKSTEQQAVIRHMQPIVQATITNPTMSQIHLRSQVTARLSHGPNSSLDPYQDEPRLNTANQRVNRKVPPPVPPGWRWCLPLSWNGPKEMLS